MIQKLKGSILRFLAFWAARPGMAMLAIFGLSFAVRASLLVFYLSAGNPLYTGEADSIARSLVTKGTYADPFTVPTGPTAHCPPLYPVIGALIYAVFGLGTLGEIARCVINIIAFSLLYSLFPRIAARFGFDSRAGLLAGLVTALLPLRRSAEFLIGWEAPYAALFLALMLAWTLALWRKAKPDLRVVFLWGMAWGVASLLQTSLFAILLALCGLLLLVRRELRSAAIAAIALMGCFLVLIPWIVRDRVELGAWMFVRSNLGIELELGNRDGAGPDVEENFASRIHPFGSKERSMEVRMLGEVEYNRRALRRAVSWIRRNPATFLRLSSERCFRFWFSSPRHPLEFAITFPIMIVSLWGMLRRLKTHPDVITLWALAMVAFSLIYYVTQYSARYRVDVEWMWLIAAGQLCFEWLSSGARDSARGGLLDKTVSAKI